MGDCHCKNEKPQMSETVDQVIPFVDDPVFTVLVVGSRGVRRGDWFPNTCKSDCYCTVSAAGYDRILLRTLPVSQQVEPLWRQAVHDTPLLIGDSLEFSVWDSISGVDNLPEGTTERLIGRFTLDSSRFFSAGFAGELELEALGKDITGAFLTVKIKRNGQDYPDEPCADFVVQLQNPQFKALGVDLDTQANSLVYVNDVKDGVVQVYNRTAKPESRLGPGHFIIKVNGVEGLASDMVDEMNRLASLRLLVRKPFTMCVAIDKKSHKGLLAGVDFVKRSAVGCLLINQLSEGPIEEWNIVNPGREVRVGDRIIAVNGQKGKAADLLKKLKALNRCLITIVRPRTDPPCTFLSGRTHD